MSCSPRRACLGLGLVIAFVSAMLVPAPGATAAINFSAYRGDHPYARLFTEANNCAENKTANNLAGAELENRLAELRRWYSHFHSESSNNFYFGEQCRGASATTLASKLTSRGAWVSNYRNGSYVSQANLNQALNFGEAADIEADAPLSIGTFWAGNTKSSGGDNTVNAARLNSALDAAATTIRVNSAAAFRPAGAPLTWPFVNSRGTGLNLGAHSSNTHDFVSWVRIDDEIAQVVGDPVEAGGVVTLTVRRGIWGTAATSHATGARVMSPVYIGSSSAVGSDTNLAGGPNRDSTSFPLRYAIKIWQPGGYNWIAQRIKTTFGPDLSGYNTVWLDVSSCSQYNNADPYGNPVLGWDDPLGTKLTSARWGAHQKTKLAGLRNALPGVLFTGNNLGGHNVGTCTDDLLGNAYDGGVLEHWMKSDANWTLDWQKAMAQNFRIQSGNWPALYWVRWNYDFQGVPAQYKRFSYGSLLLALRPAADRYQYGGAWGLSQPDELYFWDWGTPAGTPAATTDVKVAGMELYRRDFANGMVLVNPSTTSLTYQLGGTYYDVVNKDAAGNPRAVSSVTVGPKDAAFLLKLGTPADTQAPTATIATPAPGDSLPKGSVRFTGDAADDRGVAKVEVLIRDSATGLWWHQDGTWGTAASVNATLASPGAASSSWDFAWAPPGDGTYEVFARAVDTTGNAGSAPPVTFSVFTPDATAPETFLDPPAGGQAGQAMVFSGSATDNRGVTAVKIGVQNQATGDWWRADGTWGTFQSHDATLASPGAVSTGWSFSWAPPAAGSYGVSAVAWDAAPNGDPSGAWSTFSVTDPDTVAPETLLDPPTGGPAGQALVFSGNATDNRGVTTVKVAVEDQATGKWWRADGTWGAFQSHEASLASPGAASTAWSFSWAPPAVGSYGVSAIAWDAEWNGDPSRAWATFSVTDLDTSAPETFLDPPTGGPAGRALAFSGNATDTRGVTAVKVAIQDQATGKWWRADGTWGTFQSHDATLASPGAPSTGWAFTWTPTTQGTFGISATAWDAAWNSDPSRAWATFKVTKRSGGGKSSTRNA